MNNSRSEFLTRNEAGLISDFVAEETRRQGDGPLDVGYMLQAWYDAITQFDRGDRLSLDQIISWAQVIDPEANGAVERFRVSDIFIGWEQRGWANIERSMDIWIEHVHENIEGLIPRNPIAHINSGDPTHYMVPGANDWAYYQFETIHPFNDGNGRTGKIIYNWLEGTLRSPRWPHNFWGVSNP